MKLKFVIIRDNLKSLRTYLKIFMLHNKQSSTYLYFDDLNVIIFGHTDANSTTDCRIHCIPQPDATQTYRDCFMKSYEISSKQENNGILLKVVKFNELLEWINFILEDEWDGEFKLTKLKDKNGEEKQAIKAICIKDNEAQNSSHQAFGIQTVFDVDMYPEKPWIEGSKISVDKIASDTLFKSYLKFWSKEKENTVSITALKKRKDSQSDSSQADDLRFDFLEVSSNKNSFKCYGKDVEEETEVLNFSSIFSINLYQSDFYRIFATLQKSRFNMNISYNEPDVLVHFAVDECEGLSLFIKAKSIIED